MLSILPKKLIDLAQSMDKPLYLVGGLVRNFLIFSKFSGDMDLCAPIKIEDFSSLLIDNGFHLVAEYKRTGTIVFSDGENKYEYASFRSEKYLSGEHTPYVTEFTEDIVKDALRRDFKCNAIYYDIKNAKFVDPLNGIVDVKNKVLDTVTKPDDVFKNDGLRLMRLARFAGELNFTPTEDVMRSAEKNADNLDDISRERIYTELLAILKSDKKYPFSDKNGHYTGLKILDRTRVLDRIFPELTMGRNMVQRADFHKYDVLEHSLRSVLYSPEKVRLGALLHDVGKPFCYLRDGMYYLHFAEGEKIADKALKRLKADKKSIELVRFLVKEHMVDLDCSMSEKKVRKFIVKNYDRLTELMCVKQADFRASLEVDDTAPTLIKWERILKKMKVDGTPFSVKDLKISASDLIQMGYNGAKIGTTLKKLLATCITNPSQNNRETLIKLAKSKL